MTAPLLPPLPTELTTQIISFYIQAVGRDGEELTPNKPTLAVENFNVKTPATGEALERLIFVSRYANISLTINII